MTARSASGALLASRVQKAISAGSTNARSRGGLALADALVSWGDDGAIRFWSLAGEPRLGGDARAHEGGVSGVLALTEGLLSWGGDEVIRRWSRDGKSIARCWIDPAPIEVAVSNGTDVWVGLRGRPHRLLFEVA
ncbi:hypothetical protein ACVIQT_005972 [Bradyrhizobium diazoefficiens]